MVPNFPHEDSQASTAAATAATAAATLGLTWSRTKQSQRRMCSRCHRPIPGACICESLPTEPIALHKCRILVLQHPQELKRKNRSLPLLQLSLVSQTNTGNDNNDSNDSNSYSLHVSVGRRLGTQTSFQSILDDESEPLLLLYPGPGAMSLEEAMHKLKQETNNNHLNHTLPMAKKVNILVLDGTWKYSKEMDRSNTYPDRMIRVQLQPPTTDTASTASSSSPTTTTTIPNFQPRRFDIRTPPSDNHLSTTEAIAWVVSYIEQDPTLYNRLLEPMDCMVAKWKSYRCSSTTNRSSNRNNPEERQRDGRDPEPKEEQGLIHDTTTDNAPADQPPNLQRRPRRPRSPQSPQDHPDDATTTTPTTTTIATDDAHSPRNKKKQVKIQS